MPARKPSSGKRAVKKTVQATENKFGKAARVAAQLGGKKPVAWQKSEAPRRAEYVPPEAMEEAAFAKASVFSATAARTLDASVSDVFRAFNDPMRRDWCHERMFSVRAAVAPRMLKLEMPDKSFVLVSIARKGNSRCMVSVEQSQMLSADAADRAKTTWKQSLDRLAMKLDE